VSNRRNPPVAQLHDELGGLLVAPGGFILASAAVPPAIRPSNSASSASRVVSSGVDLKRRVVEESGPPCSTTWACSRAAAGIQRDLPPRRTQVHGTIPDSEPEFNPDAAIGVFRIARSLDRMTLFVLST